MFEVIFDIKLSYFSIADCLKTIEKTCTIFSRTGFERYATPLMTAGRILLRAFFFGILSRNFVDEIVSNLYIILRRNCL